MRVPQEVLGGTPDVWTFNRLPGVIAELDVDAKHVVHVGAHLGEEVPAYRWCGFGQITLVEPDPANCDAIREAYPEVAVHALACAQTAGEAVFHRNAFGPYSGLLVNHRRPTTATFTVRTVPLRELQGDANVAVIDTQGTELDVARSADLETLDLLIVETQELGRDGTAAYLPDLVDDLRAEGWRPVWQWLHHSTGKWRTYADTFFAPARRT
jgi:FkbM family methyltransferase